MSWTYNEAAELLGETGQTVAGNLIAYDGRRPSSRLRLNGCPHA